jgi:hypothetical protein
MKQSPGKLGELKAVSALEAASARVIDHRAGVASATRIGPVVASATKIEPAVATIAKMEATAYTTAKGETGVEVEVAGARARAVDQVEADVPPANVFVHDRNMEAGARNVSPVKDSPFHGLIFETMAQAVEQSILERTELWLQRNIQVYRSRMHWSLLMS